MRTAYNSVLLKEIKMNLIDSIEICDYKVFFRLINRGADLNMRNKYAETPLILAAATERVEFVRELLSHNADPEAADNNGATALHCTAYNGNPVIVRLLLNQGINIDPRESIWKWTPLHLASRQGHRYVARLLLAYGADKEAKDKKGKTPSDYAKDRRDYRFLEILSHQPEEFFFDESANSDGTSLQANIKIIPHRMVAIFGMPGPGVPEKFTGIYTFINKKKEVFTVYDWKEPQRVGDFWFMNFAEYTVNICGYRDASDFIRWLLGVFNDRPELY
jgi:hypothetical protein